MTNKAYIENLKANLSSFTGLEAVQAYKTPYATEELWFGDSRYFIVSATLRGFTRLIRAIPKGFAGEVYIPVELCDIIKNKRVLREEGAFSVIAFEKKPAPRFDFNIIDSKKNPVYQDLKRADTLSHRKEDKTFVLEEERLVKRAVDDEVYVHYIVYTTKSALLENNTITKAKEMGIPCFMINDGLMSTLTTTHPTPREMALCSMPEYTVEDIPNTAESTLLIADNIENPDNLGLIIRTADACGADAVIAIGKQASIYHKNNVRASRGAMGRMPVFEVEISEFDKLIRTLKDKGYKIFGSSAKTKLTVHDTTDVPLKAFVVSNETFGISDYMEKATDEMIRIPMASGQSSFNVAVAAGIILAGAIRFEE